jgi:hypothetical protein
MTALDVTKLMWGQEQEYDADQDRLVITALSDRRYGLARPPALDAGTGLVLNVGGWAGIVNCEDGTDAVVGTRETQALNIGAGPSSGTRTDVIWADIDVDAGTYTLAVITPLQATGRAGVELGRVVAGTGHNTVAAMTRTPARRAVPRVQSVWTSGTDTVNNQAQRNLANLPRVPVFAGKRYTFFAHFMVSGLAATGAAYMAFGGSSSATEFHMGQAYTGGGGYAGTKQQTVWGSNSALNSGAIGTAACTVLNFGRFRAQNDGEVGFGVAASANVNTFRVDFGVFTLTETGDGDRGLF